jgi:hypothetical protein
MTTIVKRNATLSKAAADRQGHASLTLMHVVDEKL